MNNPRRLQRVEVLWRIASVVFLAVASASCCPAPADGEDAVGKGLAALSAQLVDGAWELRVDRTIPSGSGSRSNELIEADYQPVSDGSTYSILISDQGSHVTIGEAHGASPGLRFPTKGSRTSVTKVISYDLSEGTFAGGRLVVWSAEQTPQAELTVYGSGVPIVSSVRGKLARSDR